MPREVHRKIIIFDRRTAQSEVGTDVNTAKSTVWLTGLMQACKYRVLPAVGKVRKNTRNTVWDAHRKEAIKEDEEVVFKVIPF